MKFGPQTCISQKIIPGTSVQDLNPRPCVDNTHMSVLSFEMTDIEPDDGEIPPRKLTWKPLGFLSHIKRRTIDDRFVPIPVLIGPSQQYACNVFRYDS